MKKLIILTAFALASTLATASSIKILGYINANNCSSCNGVSKVLKRKPDLLRHTTFIFSRDYVTQEQAEEFMSELLGGARYEIRLDNQIFGKLESELKSAKMPQLLLYDTLRSEIVFTVSIDSLHEVADVFEKFIDFGRERKVEVVKAPRISRMIGFKHLTFVHNKFFVYSYQNATKVYFYDLNAKVTDSIFINDDYLQRLYLKLGIKQKVEDVRRYYEENTFPVPMYHFHSEPFVDGQQLNMYMSIMFYDPQYKGDTIRPQWFSFIASYNVASRELEMFPVRSWTKNFDEGYYDNTEPIYYPDYVAKWRKNDSSWIASSDKVTRRSDSTDKVKLFLKYQFDRKEKLFVSTGTYDSIFLKNVRTFRGKSFNDINTHYSYKIVGPYLFFNESNQFFDMSRHEQVSLSGQLAGLNWISDIELTENTISVVGLENENELVLVLLDRKDRTVLQRKKIAKMELGTLMNGLKLRAAENRDVDLMYMSNIQFDQGAINYLNRQGELIRLD